MLNRTLAPAFGKVENTHLPTPALHHLDNGIPVHVIDAGRQELLKVEVVFPAGDTSSEKKLVAAATASLMDEGTTQRSGAAIAEAVDFYGAHLQSEIDSDETVMALYTLNAYLKETLPVLAEVYNSPSFPAEELEIYARNHRQSAEINEQKVSHLASRAFKATVYGQQHPLGREIFPADYASLVREDIVGHFEGHIRGNIQHIMVAGKLTADTLPLLNAHFGKLPMRQTIHHVHASHTNEAGRLHVDKEGAVQNAIRVGRMLFNRNHPDFAGMQFLVTVLGGYFGSRLMANIREDKGYTYGVSASLTSLRHTGHLTISTEVGSNVCDAALAEIFKETALLRTEPVSQKEVDTVRNYLLGLLLKGLDGPFALSSKWRSYLKYGVGTEAHEATINQFNTMTPERLMHLAHQYLQDADMHVVTAGAKTV